MRALFLCLALSFAGCAAGGAYIEPMPPSGPAYVYTYVGGGCWADDLWYGACPWYVGPEYGYHAWYGGQWYHHPNYVWPRDHRQPPPRGWRSQPAPRGRVPAAPPRAWPGRPVIRDHRRR